MPSSRTSSSRPTPGRAHHYQKGYDSYAEQNTRPRQDDLPDWASGPFTLYISYLHAHVPEKMLFSVLRQTGLGMMRRQGAIELTKHNARDGGYPFQSAKIHFDFLFTRGEQRDQNLQVLDHLLHGGDDAHFQVVYQAAKFNPKTGKEEPDRFWKIKAWREGQRSASPAGSPSLKISLHGGSIGPKDVQKKQTTADSDGFVTPKSRGATRSAVNSQTKDAAAGGQTIGGGFAALAESPSESVSSDPAASTSPKPMTKTAKKNAKRRAAKQRKLQANQQDTADSAAVEVAKAIAEHSQNLPEPMTEEEMAECDAEIEKLQSEPTNDEIATAAAEFLAENQIAEEGAESPGAWQMDAATGSMIFHDEMTAEDAETLVPPAEVLDVDGLHESIKTAETEGK